MAPSRSEKARSKALSAAIEIFGEAGFASFTVEEVARRSGVAKTTIYRNWPSGNHLMIDALESMVAPFPTPNTGSLRSDLEAIVANVVPIINAPGSSTVLLDLLRSSIDDPEVARIHCALREERTKPIATVVELAQGRGEVSPDLDPGLVIDLVEGSLFARRFFRQQTLDDAAVAEILDMVMAAVGIN